MAASKIKVLVVEESHVLRGQIMSLLENDEEIAVVASTREPSEVREKVRELRPDVLTLGLSFPGVDGLKFLRQIVRQIPIPTIVVSPLVSKGSDKAIDALEAGAFDVARIPAAANTPPDEDDITAKIKEAFRLGTRAASGIGELESEGHSSNRSDGPPRSRSEPPARAAIATPTWHSRSVILLGASTGGTEALKEVLLRLPAAVPPICIVQHIPAKFSKSFAERLNSICAFEVREAVDGDTLRPGLCLIAPGNHHMELSRAGASYRVRLHQGPEAHHQRPAVDVLFGSAVEAVGKYAVAALLTGMGVDGGLGMKRLRDAGAHTIAQNQASCVVYGMPAAAVQLGGASQVLSLESIPVALMRHLTPRQTSEAAA